MKKPDFDGRSRYAGAFLIIMQGMLCIVLSIFLLNQAYMQAWENYPETSHALKINLENIPEDRQEDTLQTLLDHAQSDRLFIARRDTILSDDGAFRGWRFGIYGDVSTANVSLQFLNTQILTEEMVHMLLNAEDLESTLGLEEGSVHMAAGIPTFRFYEDVVIKQLLQLVAYSDTVSGNYYIQGLETEEQTASFLSDLSTASGQSVEQLTQDSGGSINDGGLLQTVLIVLLFAQGFLNIVFFLTIVMKRLPDQGKMALLGWSASDFAKAVLTQFLAISAAAVPALVLIGWFLSGWESFSATLLGCFLAAALINLVVTGLELTIAASVILMTKALDAIHGRIPKKTLYVLGIAAYLAVSAGLVFCCAYVDQPLNELSENAKLSGRWKEVSDYYILNAIGTGEDTESFTGSSNKLDQDLYDWYTSISENAGVWMIHTEYYGKDILDTWKSSGAYGVVPEEPLWLYTVSPGYLEELGISVSPELLQSAKNGARVYLLPDTLSADQATIVEQWLKERDTKSISAGDIDTAFTREQKFQFVQYKPARESFTWSVEPDETLTTAAPVIRIAVPENLKYTETEGLRVSGLQGYLKFANKDTMKQFTSVDYLAQFNLEDNNLVFSAVQVYIDGLQKQLGMTVLWFGGGFLALFLILAGILITLAAVFRIANQEKINVKKFLGYGTWEMYRGPILLLTVVLILELIIITMIQSRFGLLLILLTAVLQLGIFVKYMSRCELKQLLKSFKGE